MKQFFITIFIIVIINDQLLFSEDRNPEYNTQIQKITRLYNNFEYETAIFKLNSLKVYNFQFDYKYYNLYGNTLVKLNRNLEALDYFEKSIELKEEQPELLIYLIDEMNKNNKIKKSLIYSELYLKYKSDDQIQKYINLILLSRSGEYIHFHNSLNNIKENNVYKDELEGILEDLNQLQIKKEYEKIAKISEKYIPYFPDNEMLHTYYIHALLQTNSAMIENALLNQSAIYYESPDFVFKYGWYLLENKNALKALDCFRRSFTLELNKNGLKANREYLFPIRQYYYNNHNSVYTQSIDYLVELLKNVETIDLNDLLHKLKVCNYNRELLIFTLFYLKTNKHINLLNQYLKIYKQYDQKNNEQYFSDVISPFPNDPLKILSLN